jgi:CheY-like chemotaxis protein
MTLKLLVIDDSTNIHRIVGLAFSGEDAILECLPEAQNALETVRDFKPHVVLVDAFMPGISGYEICTQIKQDPELKETPVVLLAGTFEPFDESEASRAKCDGFLTKPFDTSDLLQTVHYLAEGQTSTSSTGAAADSFAGGEPSQANAEAKTDDFRMHGLVDATVRDSFLGSSRILDLFDNDQLSAVRAAMTASVHRSELNALKNAPSTDSATTFNVMFSENTLNKIVDAVMRRMSAEAIREVAWEVVPELSESIIRHTMEEQNKL